MEVQTTARAHVSQSGTVSPYISVSVCLVSVMTPNVSVSMSTFSEISRFPSLKQPANLRPPTQCSHGRGGAQLDEERPHHRPLAHLRHTDGRLAVPGVAPHVFGEVVRAHEPALADVARELLLARVGPLVSGELVRTGEGAATLGPLADERLLA